MPVESLPAPSRPESGRTSARVQSPEVKWPVAWVVCAVGAVVALAKWQQAPDWPLLIAAALGTLGAAIATRWTRVPRAWAGGAVAWLTVGVVISAHETRTLKVVASDWASWSAAEREQRGQSVAAKLTQVAADLKDAAAAAVADTAMVRQLLHADVPVSTLRAPPIGGDVETGLLLFVGNRLVARAGQTRTPISPFGVARTQLVEGPFHTSLVSRAVSADGSVQAVALALVASAPPADRFVQSLTQTLAGRIAIDRTVVESPDSARVVPGSTVVLVTDGASRLARVRALAFSEGETQESLLQRARARSGIPLAIAVLLVLVMSWRRPARTAHRVATTLGLLWALAVAPLNALSNVSALFDASSYYAPMGGRLTANVAALLLTASLLLATLFLVMRASRVTRLTRSRAVSGVLVVLVAGLGPFLLRDLARGIHLPQSGASTNLWMALQLALALAGATVLLAGATVGQSALGRRRGIPPITAPLLAIVSAMVAPSLWQAPGAWPAWYPVCWIVSIGALAFTRRGVALVLGVAVVAGTGAVTLTWGEIARARMAAAEHDMPRISATDENALTLLRQFAISLTQDVKPAAGGDALLRRFAASDLALAGYPARIARWSPTQANVPILEISLAPISDTVTVPALSAALVRQSGIAAIFPAEDGPSTILVAAIPYSDGTVTTVAVPPTTGLRSSDPFAALTGITGARPLEPAYRLTLAATSAGDASEQALTWRRRGTLMHGDGIVGGGSGARRVHVEVDLRSADVLIPRGALLVLLDLGVVMLLWGASAMADGAFRRWLRVRRMRWRRSYRVRLSLALLAFFVAPAAIFAAWSWYRLQDDDAAARELLVREALRVAAFDVERRQLSSAGSSAGTPLFLYRDGQLAAASDALLDALAPLGRLLPTSLAAEDFGSDDVFATRRLAIGGRQALVGFRRLPITDATDVLATPARGDEFALDARRADLGVLLLFVTALGALAALWSSGVAARSLARPVGALREAALSIAAGGEDPSLGVAPAAEFAPVYRAFGRMARDLSTGRAALEAAQRRTDAVLQNVASGVLALRPDGEILLANPRAAALLSEPVRARGASLGAMSGTLEPLVTRCMAFLGTTGNGALVEDAFEVSVQGRQLRARLTRLPNGAVLTVDDVTELATAQRVLAWGEMARQIAHEIKNPLTPIRLGVQHLRRAFRDGRADFATILDTNVSRVLAEIDHLDEIARAFSRYGMAPADRARAVSVDVDAVVRDVLALERMGESEVRWQQLPNAGASASSGSENLAPAHEAPAHEAPAHEAPVNLAMAHVAMAQRDELKEVLLNVLENARLAQAREVTVRLSRARVQEIDRVLVHVADDGVGIAATVLDRVFEPHFSTRTSGSGLGLAISRRLIESWGGSISLQSAPDVGTTVEISLLATT